MIRVLVTDDEALARDRLRRLIADFDGIETVGEAGDGREALERCAALAPDIVLLDIRMPGMDGLETARHLAGWPEAPAVIFTTAYGDHALAAFEAHAVDYLLKPIRGERLREALARAHALNRNRLDAARRMSDAAPRGHICARNGQQIRLIPLAGILYFRADHKYVTVRHSDGEVLIEESLKALEQEFADRFVRIHRNCLVALDRVTSLERRADGQWRLHLRDADESLEISRRHVAPLRSLLRRSA